MNRPILGLVIFCAAAFVLLSSGVWAQEASVPEGPASGEAVEEEASAGSVTEETVVLSPWRVGSVGGEARKEEAEKRRERVLREAEKKKRDAARHKKEVRERAARKKKEDEQFFPTDY